MQIDEAKFMDPFSCLRNVSYTGWLKLAKAVNLKMDVLKEKFPYSEGDISELIIRDNDIHVTLEIDGTPKSNAFIAGVNNPAKDFDYVYKLRIWTNDGKMVMKQTINSGTGAVNILRERMGLNKIHFGVFELI